MSLFMNISLPRPYGYSNASSNIIFITTSGPAFRVQNDDVTYTNNDDTDYDNNNDVAASYLTVIRIQKVTIPLLCLLGLLFNAMSVRILVQRTLRQKSCCMYLTTKCITDTVFLAALFVVWLDRIHVPWFHRHGVCQIIVFTTYVCAFTSVWLVVMVTGENYIRICHPHRVHTLCTVGNARVCLVCLGLVSVFCYQFPLWTVHSVNTADNITRCALIPEYDRYNNGLTYFDTALTLVIPLIIVLAFMAAIFHQLWISFRRNRRMKKLGRQRHTHFLCLSPYGRVTAMLLAVSLTFIILHTPSHVIRLQLLLTQAVDRDVTNDEQQYRIGIGQLRLQRLFELLYYCSFSTNWLTYFSFGKQFRDLFKRTFCKCFLRRRPPPACATCNCSRRERVGNKGNCKTGQFQFIIQEGALPPNHQSYVCLSLGKRSRSEGGCEKDHEEHGDEDDDEDEDDEEEDVMVTEMGMVSTECVQLSYNSVVDTRVVEQ